MPLSESITKKLTQHHRKYWALRVETKEHWAGFDGHGLVLSLLVKYSKRMKGYMATAAETFSFDINDDIYVNPLKTPKYDLVLWKRMEVLSCCGDQAKSQLAQTPIRQKCTLCRV